MTSPRRVNNKVNVICWKGLMLCCTLGLGNQHWIYTGRTDAEAPILWPPDAKSQLIGEDPDAGKDWGQEEKGVTEDEMVGWHHQLNGHEFEQTPGDGEGQESLACCNPWVAKSQTRLSDWTDFSLYDYWSKASRYRKKLTYLKNRATTNQKHTTESQNKNKNKKRIQA